MTGRPLAVLVLAVIGAAAAVAGQQRDRPQAAPAPVGTGVIAGRVIESETSDVAVRRAVITIVADDGIHTHSTVADADGRFMLSGLPAGRYSLLAKKGGHLTSSYGARRPGRAGTTLILAEGQQLTDLRVALPRGGVITGTARLPGGEPLANTQVVAILASEATAGGRTINTARFDTDDRGIYRIYGLMPGEYIIGVLPDLGRGEVQRRSAAEYEDTVRAQTALLRQPAGGAVESNLPPDVPTVGYAPTYFPGTTVAADAARVRVEAGEVREGIDIPVDTVRMSRISGVVRGVDGQPTQAVMMSADAAGPALPISASAGPRTGRPAKDGTFVITNVAPGSYRVTVRGGGVTLSPTGMSVSGDRQTEWAVADVVVQGSDVEGVLLQLQPGLMFSGSLAAAGQGDPPATWKGARVAVQPPRTGPAVVLNGQLMGGISPRSAAVRDDGTFEVTGLQPATYEVVVTLPAPLNKTWTVQSVRAGDRDLRDAPLTFEQGSIRDVRITVTDRRTELVGTFSSASGQAATDYYVVIFPADRTLWHPLSPRLRVTRPTANGGFSVPDLPAGAYRIAAVTDVEGDEWRTTAFLESIYDASIAVTVAEGQTTRQDIRIR